MVCEYCFFFDLSRTWARVSFSTTGLLLILLLSSFVISGFAQESTALVPAIITFGDSSVDVGNNDYLSTFFKADFPPYGRDFINHKPTGRFCNGKLATDITAETLGFTTYAPAYLSPQASGKNLLIGANFASAGSGYYDKTAMLSQTISLSQQLEYYKEYQGKLAKVAGSKKAASIITDALYLVGAGNSDFVQNYYVNPLLNKVYTPDQFSSFLVGIFSSFIKELYGLGARRVGVTSLPPLGCLPAAITLFGMGKNGCVSRINTDAQGFNKKINAAASTLQKQLPGLKIAILDIYTPFLDAIKSPSKYGFSETNRGCCGTGTVETTVFLCNPKSPGTCSNATQYIFWDSVHPSQAANQVIADAVIIQGISLIG
ncbi:GDSL esterase/lipase APG [Telopea speciosissima]|uniref:GDSL esterase/lipase APG n=1 Tax=Telopea speciosissima TaxID=54955 RepID=UPI001CC57DF3|nr:GDSL esterase/lipase APG [Telopea speciosissima]XP_043697291.1 GDSL esterase/lipase APG [Telopea speciosissima]